MGFQGINIHSIAKGTPTDSRIIVKGLPEPYEKRTVEGDLGIRYNAQTILDMIGEKGILMQNIPNLNIEEFNLKDKVKKLSEDIGFVPESDTDFFVDTALARAAAKVATERHAGLIKEITSFYGTVYALFGKDLTEIKTLVGTGGIFVYGKSPERVLETALLNESNPMSLSLKSLNST